MKKGIFITFEGIEGCGKSTQAEMLRDSLQERGEQVLLTREPGGPGISEKIRDILLDRENTEMLPETEMLLYMASRSQHTGEWILPALETGKIVISDRYFDSTIAYQGAARLIDRTIIDIITGFATFGTMPDLTFLLDLPVEVGLARIGNRDMDRLENEAIEFHEKVRKGFLKIARTEKKRYIVLDGMKKESELHRKIIEHVDTKIRGETL